MTSGLFDLRGKVAIVTGGNGGIGLGMARGLADAGADIAVVGRNEAKSNAAVADLTKAFSSEVEAGSRQENASYQESRERIPVAGYPICRSVSSP